MKYLNEEEYEIALISQSPIIYQNFYVLTEMFDTKIEVKIIEQDSKYFVTEFHIKNRPYKFHAKQVGDNEWGVLFFHNATNPFDLIRKGNFVGDVFSGVFESLRLFVSLYNIKLFHFSTHEDKLKSLYDSIKPYFEKRTGFKLANIDNKEDQYTQEHFKIWTYKNPNYKA